MATKSKPVCETVFPWLKANLGNHCLGVLTGTDWKALQAAVQIINPYAYYPSANVIHAFANVVNSMQPEAHELAYHSIAHILDWPDRQKIWSSTSVLNPITNPRRCTYE